MRDWIPRIVILVLLAVVVGLPVVWGAFTAQVVDVAEDAATQRLIVITPHNEQIRYEFERAFNRWHAERHGQPVEISWRAFGTSEIERMLFAQYEAAADAGTEDEGAGYDVCFGGGDYMFDAKFKRGFEYVGRDHKPRRITITQPIELDPEFIEEVYPTQDVAGNKLYDPDGHWWGAALSSFGIVYNNDVLHLRSMQPPVKWSDLTEGRYVGWIAMGDPSHSGSVRKTYDIIMQHYGWDVGWATLRRICANARYFTSSSQKVPLDVSSGEAAAGMCIDFYGRLQSQIMGPSEIVTGPDGQSLPRIHYIAPPGVTAFSADPVAVLRGATHRELAIRFVKFVLSTEGQALWNFHTGATVDGLKGPEQFELRRAPVRRDMYQQYHEHLIDSVNPFEIAEPLPPGTPSYFGPIPTVLHAMAMDVHQELREAWKAIQAAEAGSARQQKMLAKFDAMPFTEQQLNEATSAWSEDRGRKDRDRLAWTRFFLKQYKDIVQGNLD